MLTPTVPACPGCQQWDKVEPIGIRPTEWIPNALPDVADLASWWCSRCNGRLSALPAAPTGLAGTHPFDKVVNPPLFKEPARKPRKRKEAP